MAITDRQTGVVADFAWVTTLTSTTSPSIAEINAGTRFECGIVGDSMDTPRTGQTTDISALCDRETFNIPTIVENGNISAMLWREFDGTDVYWALATDETDPPPTAYLVVCRGGFSGASGVAATGDNVDVYTVRTVSRSPVAPSKTEAQQFEWTIAVQGTAFDSTCAA